MSFCTNCGKEVSEDAKFCPNCGRQLAIAEAAKEKVTYSKALRWISGVFGVISILGAITGLEYFAESGLGSELIVDMLSIALGIALLSMALVPHWVSSTFKIRLERGSVFAVVVIVLVVVISVAVAVGPEPPEGWWAYGA